MSLCNLVSRIMFKELSWKQRESKLLSHALYEKNLPAYDYPHETSKCNHLLFYLSLSLGKKPHELHSINCRNKYNMNHHFCRNLSQQVLHPGCKWPLTNPCGSICGLCCWDHSLQAERMQQAWWVVLWSMLPPRDGVSSLCPLLAEGLTPEATFSKQLQNVKSESSESAKTNLKELNNKNPF